uniref:Uncharacterized protein n=1 Tax=Cyprinus carpio TaxID=7962 RepID=A0A8C2G5S3_CYPCA
MLHFSCFVPKTGRDLFFSLTDTATARSLCLTTHSLTSLTLRSCMIRGLNVHIWKMQKDLPRIVNFVYTNFASNAGKSSAKVSKMLSIG